METVKSVSEPNIGLTWAILKHLVLLPIVGTSFEQFFNSFSVESNSIEINFSNLFLDLGLYFNHQCGNRDCQSYDAALTTKIHYSIILLK